MKIIYFSLASISVGLGVLGIILPILPTTPFLLLATLWYGKANERLNEKFKNSKIYKKYLEEFIETKTMTRRRKWTLLIGVDILLTISFLSISSVFLRIFLVVILLSKHWYFHRYVKVRD